MDTQTLAMAQEIDFSVLALFARATFTVKLVMIMLIAASFWSWAIIIRKHILFRAARSEAAVFDVIGRMAEGGSLDLTRRGLDTG